MATLKKKKKNQAKDDFPESYHRPDSELSTLFSMSHVIWESPCEVKIPIPIL